MTQNSADAAAASLARAETRLALGDDDGAERAYLEALRFDSENFDALNDLGVLAHRRGRRTAARLAHERSLGARPDSPVAHVNLANILMEDGALDSSRAHYVLALRVDPGFAPAHRGLAPHLRPRRRPRAKIHWALAGEGGCERRAKRGVGPGVPVLLIASAKLGNMPISPWLDDGLFDAHILEAESFDGDVLPPMR